MSLGRREGGREGGRKGREERREEGRERKGEEEEQEPLLTKLSHHFTTSQHQLTRLSLATL